MPQAVTPWVANVFPTAKSLNLALYTCDGTNDNPNGILFNAFRPCLFETYNRTLVIPGSAGGTQTVLSSSGTVTASRMVFDTAGFYGNTSDLPGLGYYQFASVIPGTSGDGVTPGGLFIMTHFAAVKPTSTQTSLSADLLQVAGGSTQGSIQKPTTANDSTAFFCDLVNVGISTWQPAVTLRDSGAASGTLATNTTDSSGETSRFYALWAAASATTAGIAQYQVNGTYTFTAPLGVTSVTASGTGAGAGSGAGNVSAGGTEFGGGGGGGGEYASGAVGVTPGNNYPVTVGAGGTSGISPGGSGGAGGNTAFSGDSVTVTAHGGTAGGGATASANGTGGAGGTGSTAPTHFNGGAGATGATGAYGGGGGSSAGTAVAGNAGVASAGGSAPTGGGPGGAGGTLTISVIQTASGHKANSTSLTVSFPDAIQSGSSIFAAVAVQSASANTVTLDDGTALSQVVSATYSSGVPFEADIWSVSGVAGGEQKVKVNCGSGSNLTLCMQIYEVSGLGSSPATDVTNTSTANSGSYSVSATSAGAPDFWIGTVSSEYFNGNASINAPGSQWTALDFIQDNSGGYHTGMRSGYLIAPSPGTQKYNGSLRSSFHAAAIAAFTTSSTTPGSSPTAGPGGGAGAGLGTSNGASGPDGVMTLAWTGVTGGGYGNPPLPAPFSGWTADTAIGTSGDLSVDVDINGPAGITSVANFLANPPAVRVTGGSAQSVTTATLANLVFSGASAAIDSYSGYSAGIYTVPRTGIYVFHGKVAFAANATGTRQAGVTVNGTTYWGPGYNATSSGETHPTKTQIFALNAGDTVQLACRQDSGGALNAGSASRFFLTWLCASGAPVSAWMPPDATFRWASGTPGSQLPALFQAHLANDLGFLVNRPYLLAYQTVAQSGVTANTYVTPTLDTVNGLVHTGITGDNYTGWTAGTENLYTAPVNGWYLIVGEDFITSSAAAGATAIAAVATSASGGHTGTGAQDIYQQLSATSTASVGAGGTKIGMKYCLSGETIKPRVSTASYSGTYGTLTGSQNSGFFYPHLEIVWISE